MGSEFEVTPERKQTFAEMLCSGPFGAPKASPRGKHGNRKPRMTPPRDPSEPLAALPSGRSSPPAPAKREGMPGRWNDSYFTDGKGDGR